MKVNLLIALVIALSQCGTALAGSLEPTAPPGPTMKTLDQIPPTWNQTLQCDANACPRFEKVLSLSGVLDKETGLVWQANPSTTGQNWENAISVCYGSAAGLRGGWRLPGLAELMSLLEGSGSARTLPAGHPFGNIQSALNNYYWTSTSNGSTPTAAWAASFHGGQSNQVTYMSKTGSTNFVWCVRGGRGSD